MCLRKTHLDSCRGRFKRTRVKGGRPGCFLILEVEKKETEEKPFGVPDGRNRWCREETNKEEGESSRLRPQAEQIQDSGAAGSSLRQDNRADGCRKEIRSVKSTVHPGVYAAGSSREPCLVCTIIHFHQP